MSKTITLENPITAIGRYLAKRKIVKMSKKVEKLQSTISKLESKYSISKTPSNDFVNFVKDDDIPNQTTKKAQMSIKDVSEKFGNKIIFKKNMRNNHFHADKGMIDGKFLEYAESTKWLNVSPNPKNSSEMRVFFNHVSNGQKALLTKHALTKGWVIQFE